MTDRAKARTIVITEITEREGPEAAAKCSADSQAFRHGERRVIAALTMEVREIVERVRREFDTIDPETAEDLRVDALVKLGNLNLIVSLDPAGETAAKSMLNKMKDEVDDLYQGVIDKNA